MHCARPDPSFPRTEQVRWRSLQRRLVEMGSVARLLKEYRYEVKALRGGRWEVRGGAGSMGKAAHTFASDNDLWRWTYILAMDGVDSAQAGIKRLQADGSLMGKLFDTKFWADTLNDVTSLKPPLGQPIKKADASRIKSIACKAFSTVLDDPMFHADIAHAISLAKSAHVINSPKTKDFEKFLDDFMRLENKLLADAGVNSVASRDLAQEIRRIAVSPDPSRFDQLEQKIVFCRKLACDPKAAYDPKKPIWQVALRAVEGLGLIGVDAGAAGGAAVILGPFGVAAAETVAAISGGYGAAIIAGAIKGRW